MPLINLCIPKFSSAHFMDVLFLIYPSYNIGWYLSSAGGPYMWFIVWVSLVHCQLSLMGKMRLILKMIFFFFLFFFLGGPTVHSLLSNIIAHCTYGFGTIPWFSLKNRWIPLSWIALILYQPCLSKLIIFKVILMTC